MASRLKPRRTGALALAVAAASFLGLATHAQPAHATSLGLACPNPTAQVFAPWGDWSNYAAAPDGGFESGASGWKLAGGAAVVRGSEPFAVTGPGAYALSLPAGSSATSPPMCVGVFSGKMRFFTVNGGRSSSRLRVQVIYGGGTGGLLGVVGSTLGVSDVGSIASGSQWQPSSPVSMLGGTLPLLTQWVQFRFTPADSSGAWRIDDVELDPLMYR